MDASKTEKSSIPVQNFKPDDLKKLLYIFRLNVPEFFAAEEEPDFRNYLHKNADKYFTIWFGGIMVGGAGYKIIGQKKSGAISWIFLHPHYRGRGLGKHTVNFLVDILKKDKNLIKIGVKTSQYGYPFFSSLGFNMVRKVKNYWGEGLDLYDMEMNI